MRKTNLFIAAMFASCSAVIGCHSSAAMAADTASNKVQSTVRANPEACYSLATVNRTLHTFIVGLDEASVKCAVSTRCTLYANGGQELTALPSCDSPSTRATREAILAWLSRSVTPRGIVGMKLKEAGAMFVELPHLGFMYAVDAGVSASLPTPLNGRLAVAAFE
ncbi:MAG: hypothetical protein WCK65_12895 [Rhodospirillaceae bacterium]